MHKLISYRLFCHFSLCKQYRILYDKLFGRNFGYQTKNVLCSPDGRRSFYVILLVGKQWLVVSFRINQQNATSFNQSTTKFQLAAELVPAQPQLVILNISKTMKQIYKMFFLLKTQSLNKKYFFLRSQGAKKVAKQNRVSEKRCIKQTLAISFISLPLRFQHGGHKGPMWEDKWMIRDNIITRVQ